MLVDVAILLIINFVAVDKTKGVDIFGPGTANVFIWIFSELLTLPELLLLMYIW